MSQELKDRLNEALAAKGMSQAQLASDIGVSAAAVSAWCSGTKRPGVANLQAIANRLGVTPSYLQFGEGPGAVVDLDDLRQRYREELEWYWRPAPADGGRELGNAAGFAFKVDIETLGRESGQNSLDERLLTEPTVEMRYSVIELTGAHLEAFLKAVQFKTELRRHLEASSTTNQKIAAVIARGLERLETEQRLLLIRIEDYNATGLLGGEYEPGRFMAVVRNILDSYKSDTAGGSYGLGKATLWASSQFGLVLINSTLSVAQDGDRSGRFIGRIELPWHKDGTDSFAGPGWFGELDPDKGCTRSYWSNAAVLHDLMLEREGEAPGTSFLIVGAFDPSGAVESVEEIADRLRRSLADSFWPAMVDRPDGTPARLRVVVRSQRNEKIIAEHFVDPEEFRPAHVAAFRKYLDDNIVDALDQAGDVVKRTASLKVPARRLPGSEHPAEEHEAIVLVVQAEDSDDGANKVTYLRGSHMVIHEPALTGLPVGARPFHGIVLAGEAAGSTSADRAAERFLRAAEPPAHDKWTSTPDVTTNFARGGPTFLRNFEEAVRRAIREVVRQPAKDLSDGPESLKELLRIAPPKPETESRPRVKSARGNPTDAGAWFVEATVSLPPRDRPWSVVPSLRFGTESGAAIPVRWKALAAEERCDVDGDRLVAKIGARLIRFSGVTDPSSHPVGAARAKVLVDVRVYEDAR